MISHWTSSLLIQQGWLANRPPRTQPHILATGITNTMPWIYMGVWDSNSGPYPCIVGISLTEPSPHPTPKVISKMWIIRRRTCPRSLACNAGSGEGRGRAVLLEFYENLLPWVKAAPILKLPGDYKLPGNLSPYKKTLGHFWGFMYEKKCQKMN